MIVIPDTMMAVKEPMVVEVTIADHHNVVPPMMMMKGVIITVARRIVENDPWMY